MRKLILALSAISLLTGSASAFAAPCRDAKGKFMKCPTKTKTVTRCKDAKGKFAKCGTPGAKPA